MVLKQFAANNIIPLETHMKKIITLVATVAFFLNAHGQSITATYFANIFQDENLKEHLTSRSFTQIAASTSDKGSFENYTKNVGTASEEKIYKTEKSVTYLTRNKTYINNLVKQLTHSFKLARQDEEDGTAFYQFTCPHSIVTVNLAKAAGTYSSLMVIQK
jgi:hypothetical protein